MNDNQEKKMRLPAAVGQMLEVMNDPKQPWNIRYNYRLTLLNISNVCKEAVDDFDLSSRRR